MKKTILLVALILLSVVSIAQIKFGVRGGMTLSTYYSAQSIYQFKPGIHIGGIADIPIGSSEFSFVPGLYFADKGTKTEGYYPPRNVDFVVRPEEFDFNQTHYNYQLEIPLLFTYKITLNEKLTLKPQIGAFVSYTMFGRVNTKLDYFFSYDPNPPSEISEDYYFYDGIYLGFGGNLGVSAFYNKYSFTLSCDVSNLFETRFYSNYPDICMFFSLGYNF